MIDRDGPIGLEPAAHVMDFATEAVASGGEENELPEAVRTITKASTGDAVFVVGPDYRIVHWDPRAESLTGLMAEEMLGRSCYDAVLGECEGGSPFCVYGCSVMQLALRKRAVSSYDMRIRTRSGEKRWVNVSNLRVDCEDGPYLVHLLRDAQCVRETLEMARGLIQISSKPEAGTATPASRSLKPPELTPRQLEVLRLLARGMSNKGIARELYLSQATVRNHVSALLLALGAHSQLEALARARELGMLG